MATKRPPASARGEVNPNTYLTTMKAIVQHRCGTPDVLALEVAG